MKNFIQSLQFGNLIERRDGSTEIIVSFSDVDIASMSEHNTAILLDNEIESEGLYPTYRFLDIVRVWGPVSSHYGFNSFEPEHRLLEWEGNLIPYLTRDEYLILSYLRPKFKEYFLYKSDDTMYMVSSAAKMEISNPSGLYFDCEYIELPFEDLFLTLLSNESVSPYTIQELLDFNILPE